MNSRMAWIENGVVVNLILIRPEQIEEFERPGRAVVDFEPLDVWVGDEWDGASFWRDGVRLAPPSPAPQGPATLPEDAQAALESLGVVVYEDAAC